jgi:hypothetical protein
MHSRRPPTPPARRFDHLGALLITSALGSVVFGLIEGPARGWSSPAVLAAFAAATLLLAGFVEAERRQRAPLVDLKLVRQPVFAAANLSAATMMFALLATSVYVSAFLQTFRALTPLHAGLALLPLGASTALLAAVSGRHASPHAS